MKTSQLASVLLMSTLALSSACSKKRSRPATPTTSVKAASSVEQSLEQLKKAINGTLGELKDQGVEVKLDAIANPQGIKSSFILSGKHRNVASTGFWSMVGDQLKQAEKALGETAYREQVKRNITIKDFVSIQYTNLWSSELKERVTKIVGLFGTLTKQLQELIALQGKLAKDSKVARIDGKFLSTLIDIINSTAKDFSDKTKKVAVERNGKTIEETRSIISDSFNVLETQGIFFELVQNSNPAQVRMTVTSQELIEKMNGEGAWFTAFFEAGDIKEKLVDLERGLIYYLAKFDLPSTVDQNTKDFYAAALNELYNKLTNGRSQMIASLSDSLKNSGVRLLTHFDGGTAVVVAHGPDELLNQKIVSPGEKNRLEAAARACISYANSADELRNYLDSVNLGNSGFALYERVSLIAKQLEEMGGDYGDHVLNRVTVEDFQESFSYKSGMSIINHALMMLSELGISIVDGEVYISSEDEGSNVVLGALVLNSHPHAALIVHNMGRIVRAERYLNKKYRFNAGSAEADALAKAKEISTAAESAMETQVLKGHEDLMTTAMKALIDQKDEGIKQTDRNERVEGEPAPHQSPVNPAIRFLDMDGIGFEEKAEALKQQELEEAARKRVSELFQWNKNAEEILKETKQFSIYL